MAYKYLMMTTAFHFDYYHPMNYKPYPEDYWAKIQQTILDVNLAAKQQNSKAYAVFDADGTLWDMDLGENFFNFQIDQRCVDLPSHPWNHYLEMKKVNNDPRSAYLWLAQINAGKSLDQVRNWAKQAFAAIQPVPIFTEQKKIIDLFHKNEIEVFIVTASIKWAVEPGAMALGIDSDHVIGVETEVDGGLITDKAILPITYKSGKLEALLKRTNNTMPFFASGNTIGDIDLLNAATHLQLAVSAASRDDRIFQSENELLKIAELNNWLRHRFV